MTHRINFRITLGALALLVPAGCGGGATELCRAEHHCERIDGEAFCEDGYTWEDASDPENYRCVPNVDECAEQGFYGDGVCDTGCPSPDPDCEGGNGNGNGGPLPPPPDTNPIGGNGGAGAFIDEVGTCDEGLVFAGSLDTSEGPVSFEGAAISGGGQFALDGSGCIGAASFTAVTAEGACSLELTYTWVAEGQGALTGVTFQADCLGGGSGGTYELAVGYPPVWLYGMRPVLGAVTEVCRTRLDMDLPDVDLPLIGAGGEITINLSGLDVVGDLSLVGSSFVECVEDAGCGADHPRVGGWCCPAATHANDGTGACVPIGECAAGYHDGGDLQCVAEGLCSPGYVDGGDGTCLPPGECSPGFHDGGNGSCLPLGQCANGFHDGGGGTCTPLGECAWGYHDAGDGTCASGTGCAAGLNYCGGACVSCPSDSAASGYGCADDQCVIASCAGGDLPTPTGCRSLTYDVIGEGEVEHVVRLANGSPLLIVVKSGGRRAELHGSSGPQTLSLPHPTFVRHVNARGNVVVAVGRDETRLVVQRYSSSTGSFTGEVHELGYTLGTVVAAVDAAGQPVIVAVEKDPGSSYGAKKIHRYTPGCGGLCDTVLLEPPLHRRFDLSDAAIDASGVLHIAGSYNQWGGPGTSLSSSDTLAFHATSTGAGSFAVQWTDVIWTSLDAPAMAVTDDGTAHFVYGATYYPLRYRGPSGTYDLAGAMQHFDVAVDGLGRPHVTAFNPDDAVQYWQRASTGSTQLSNGWVTTTFAHPGLVDVTDSYGGNGFAHLLAGADGAMQIIASAEPSSGVVVNGVIQFDYGDLFWIHFEGATLAGGGSGGGGSGGGGSGGGGSGGGGSGGGDPPPSCPSECSAGQYTACTCDGSDPCGWASDGICDENTCATLVATPFDDGTDC